MAQQFFSSATSPNTSQLDANFTEIYSAIASLTAVPGSLVFGASSAGYQAVKHITLDMGGVGYFIVGHAGGAASGSLYQGFGYAGAPIGSITQSGTTGVLYNTTSDARLKQNIADATDAGPVIDAVHVRQYNWKSDGSFQRFGFIAQELLSVVPEAVHQPSDSAEMMAVDYSKLVPLLVSEVQALRRRVAALES